MQLNRAVFRRRTARMRKILRGSIARAIGLCIVLSGGTVFAQETPARPSAGGDSATASDASDETVARARVLFFQGAEALDHGDAMAAIAAFTESFERLPRAITMLNLAQSYRAASMPVEAIHAFEEYLRIGADDPRTERRAQAVATIEMVRRTSGSLSVATEPPGATVWLDDRIVGTTPMGSNIATLAGVHTLRVSLPGRVIVNERVSVIAGRTLSLRLQLADATTAATLRVSLMPPVDTARVSIDGLVVGTAPLARRVEPGGHRIEVVAPDHSPFRAEIVLGTMQQRTLAVHLERRTSIFARPVFWVAIAATVVAGGVTAIVLATRPAPDPSNLITVPGVAGM